MVIKALVEVAILLESSDASAIDPDFAVAAMEQLGFTLRRSPIKTRRELAAVIRSQADRHVPHDAFVLALPDALGIETDEAPPPIVASPLTMTMVEPLPLLHRRTLTLAAIDATGVDFIDPVANAATGDLVRRPR